MRKAFYHVYKVRYVLLAALMVLYLVLFLSINTGMANASDYGQDTSEINTEDTEPSVLLPFDEFEGFDVCVEGFSEESPISYVALTGGKIALINNETLNMNGSVINALDINERYGMFGAVALPGEGMTFIRWENIAGDIVSKNTYFCPETVFNDSPNVYYAVFEEIVNSNITDYQDVATSAISENTDFEMTQESLSEFDNSGEETILYEDSTYLPNAIGEQSYETEEPYQYGYYDNLLLDTDTQSNQTESVPNGVETYTAPQINSLDTDSVDSGVMTLQTDVDAFIPVPCGVEMNDAREIIIVAAILTFVAFVIVERFGRRRYGC